MSGVLRVVGAIAAGLLLAFVLLIAVEFFSSVVHPFPADFGHTEEEMCAHVERYPASVLAVVVPAWAGTALASTWLSGRLGSRAGAIFVGALLLTAVVFNVSMLPYPQWFKIANLIAIPIAVYAGLYLSRRRAAEAVTVSA